MIILGDIIKINAYFMNQFPIVAIDVKAVNKQFSFVCSVNFVDKNFINFLLID